MDAEENKVEDTDGKKFSIPSARGRRRDSCRESEG